ncbi:Hypothetical predicted protein [Mytilus galloprovincialis]|uniref:Fork-head domain-containing protein n=1 Tax=Mytilus galloprovincialis TaxID=29158 RepID=A0A8B6D6H3_MYTGA|nr:Hypothetical predicted protein [Mytilus galloprovincialis]
MLLSDIYQYIMDNFPFYNNTEKKWRNSIRHNLSINKCFVKSGRSVSGKLNYWSVHQDFIDDFVKRDFRRRNTSRRSRKSVVKTADSSSNKFNTRNDNEYVPMTLSHIGVSSYSINRPLTHKNNHIPRRIIQSPVSRFGMAKTQYTAPMQSFGSDSHVPVARKSWSEGQLCNSPSTNFHDSIHRNPFEVQISNIPGFDFLILMSLQGCFVRMKEEKAELKLGLNVKDVKFVKGALDDYLHGDETETGNNDLMPNGCMTVGNCVFVVLNVDIGG